MFELLSIDLDERLNAYCATVRANYGWYLKAAQGAEENLEIQRGIIKGSKAYLTLREDLKRGCVLPPIVLATKNLGIVLPNRIDFSNAGYKLSQLLASELTEKLRNISSEDIYIIDGLQRTNALRQVHKELDLDGPQETLDAFLAHGTRLEFWLDIPFGAIAYRMLLLNAGQRPMSMKHQVEILSRKLEEDLGSIDGIDIIRGEGRRRVRPGQFQLAKLSQAFQAWLQGQPNIDLRNYVVEQMVSESAIETLGASIGKDANAEVTDSFKQLVAWWVRLDKVIPEGNLAFLGNDTVLLGIAAAVGDAERHPTMHERMKAGLEKLLNEQITNPADDILGISMFDEVRKGIDASKMNVGQATRDLVFKAFREFFLSDATKSMSECWQFAASM